MASKNDNICTGLIFAHTTIYLQQQHKQSVNTIFFHFNIKRQIVLFFPQFEKWIM